MGGFDTRLGSLGSKFEVMIDITFRPKMGDKEWPGVIGPDKMWQCVNRRHKIWLDVITF